MDIFTIDKIYLVILFVIPGFLAMKIYATATATTLDTTKTFIEVISYSCINYAICFPLIYLAKIHELSSYHPGWYVILWVVILLIVPILLPIALIKFRTCPLALSIFPHPTAKAWDFVFSKRLPYYVIITLNNGKRIGGLFAYTSFASHSDSVQIFIEEVWDVDDQQGFISKHTRTAGMLILTTDIENIEFIGLYDE